MSDATMPYLRPAPLMEEFLCDHCPANPGAEAVRGWLVFAALVLQGWMT